MHLFNTWMKTNDVQMFSWRNKKWMISDKLLHCLYQLCTWAIWIFLRGHCGVTIINQVNIHQWFHLRCSNWGHFEKAKKQNLCLLCSRCTGKIRIIWYGCLQMADTDHTQIITQISQLYVAQHIQSSLFQLVDEQDELAGRARVGDH